MSRASRVVSIPSSPPKSFKLLIRTENADWRTEPFWSASERKLLVYVMEGVGILPGEGGTQIKLTLGDNQVHTKARLLVPPSLLPSCSCLHISSFKSLFLCFLSCFDLGMSSISQTAHIVDRSRPCRRSLPSFCPFRNVFICSFDILFILFLGVECPFRFEQDAKYDELFMIPLNDDNICAELLLEFVSGKKKTVVGGAIVCVPQGTAV